MRDLITALLQLRRDVGSPATLLQKAWQRSRVVTIGVLILTLGGVAFGILEFAILVLAVMDAAAHPALRAPLFGSFFSAAIGAGGALLFLVYNVARFVRLAKAEPESTLPVDASRR